VVTADDGFEGIASGQFSITVPPSTPEVINPINNQIAIVGTPFRATINTDTFYDVDKKQLNISANLLNGTLLESLPDWLNFTGTTFCGTPTANDIGTFIIVVTAEDPLGATVSTSFDLTISPSNVNPPILKKQIPAHTVNAGQPFSYTFPSDTFANPGLTNYILRYEACLASGASLPDWMLFNGTTRTFSGIPPAPQCLQITVSAYNQLGGYADTNFIFESVSTVKRPPIPLNALPDQVANINIEFSYPIPATTFEDCNKEELKIYVCQAGGHALPSWLKWDNVTNTLSGTPYAFDKSVLTTPVVKIEVWAKDSVGSAKATMNISIDGLLKFLLSTGLAVGSGVGAMYTLYQKRHSIWNYYFEKTCQKEIKHIPVNKYWSHPLITEENKIKEVRAFQNNEFLPQGKFLPNGLEYEENQIRGTPVKSDRYTICVIGKDGYYLQVFDLIVQDSPEDPDPVDSNSTHFTEKMKNLTERVKRCWPRRRQAQNSNDIERAPHRGYDIELRNAVSI